MFTDECAIPQEMRPKLKVDLYMLPKLSREISCEAQREGRRFEAVIKDLLREALDARYAKRKHYAKQVQS